jgi:hypothetical protein
MSKQSAQSGEARLTEAEVNRAEALGLGLVLVPLTARRFIVVNYGPARLDKNYDPIPGGSVAETNVGGRLRHYLRGSVVCGPAPYDECLVYIKDWLTVRGTKS